MGQLELSFPDVCSDIAAKRFQPCARCGHLLARHVWTDASPDTRCRAPVIGWAIDCSCTRPFAWSARVRLDGRWTGKTSFTRTQGR